MKSWKFPHASKLHRAQVVVDPHCCWYWSIIMTCIYPSLLFLGRQRFKRYVQKYCRWLNWRVFFTSKEPSGCYLKNLLQQIPYGSWEGEKRENSGYRRLTTELHLHVYTHIPIFFVRFWTKRVSCVQVSWWSSRMYDDLSLLLHQGQKKYTTLFQRVDVMNADNHKQISD